MIKKFKILIAAILIAIPLISNSQYADFGFWTELCTCNGTFDSTKYTRAEIQNTFDYLWWSPIINTSATVWELNEIDDIDIEALKNECTALISKLNSLDFVDDKFWLELRDKRVQYLEETCNLRTYTILGYSKPDTLMHVSLESKNCDYYRNSLISGGQDLIDAWININEIQKSRNGNPAKVQSKFDREFYSDQQLEYARLRVMMFGWWNCANHTINHIDSSIDFEEKFTKLFKNVNCECDEP